MRPREAPVKGLSSDCDGHASVHGGSCGTQVVPQFQHSKSSTRYFCVHHDMTGSPQTKQSAPHRPHSNTNSTGSPSPAAARPAPLDSRAGADNATTRKRPDRARVRAFHVLDVLQHVRPSPVGAEAGSLPFRVAGRGRRGQQARRFGAVLHQSLHRRAVASLPRIPRRPGQPVIVLGPPIRLRMVQIPVLPAVRAPRVLRPCVDHLPVGAVPVPATSTLTLPDASHTVDRALSLDRAGSRRSRAHRRTTPVASPQHPPSAPRGV
jgi:hypothetical protein